MQARRQTRETPPGQLRLFEPEPRPRPELPADTARLVTAFEQMKTLDPNRAGAILRCLEAWTLELAQERRPVLRIVS